MFEAELHYNKQNVFFLDPNKSVLVFEVYKDRWLKLWNPTAVKRLFPNILTIL